MKREVTAQTRIEIERQESEEFLPIFVTIEHKSLSVPIRIVTNTKDIVLDGNVYQGFEFNISLLTDSENMPSARLSVQNVDGKISAAILDALDPPKFEIQVVAIRHFDESVVPHTEIEPDSPREYRGRNLYLTNVSGDSSFISGTLRSWDYRQEVWPGERTNEIHFPGLYW